MLLGDSLLKDISSLGIVLNAPLELMSFSVNYYGRYFPKSSKIRLYIYENKNCTVLRSYPDIFLSFLHEVVHHLQYLDPSFIRLKGIMHNENFYKLYNLYLDEAKQLSLLEKRCVYAKYPNEVMVEKSASVVQS